MGAVWLTRTLVAEGDHFVYAVDVALVVKMHDAAAGLRCWGHAWCSRGFGAQRLWLPGAMRAVDGRHLAYPGSCLIASRQCPNARSARVRCTD